MSGLPETFNLPPELRKQAVEGRRPPPRWRRAQRLSRGAAMTATADALKAWKVEEARQAQILATAIDATTQETAKKFDAPIMNALCGALVTVQAAVLSSVTDPHIRKELRKAMARALPRALAEAIAKGNGHCQTVVIGAPRQ